MKIIIIIEYKQFTTNAEKLLISRNGHLYEMSLLGDSQIFKGG